MAAYYGDPGQTGGVTGGLNINDLINIRDQEREKDFNDYVRHKSFDADLAIKMDRARQMFNPDNQQQGSSGPQNVVYKPDMTNYEKAQLGLEGRKVSNEEARTAQAGKIGEERLGIQEEKNKLESAKSDQIHQVKMDDMNRKVADAERNAELARQRLAQGATNIENINNYHNAQIAAERAKNELTLAQREKEHNDNMTAANARIKLLQDQLTQRQRPTSKTTTIKNPDGTTQTGTTVTTPGSPDQDMVHVTGPKDPKTGKPQQGTMPRGSFSDYWKQQGWIINDKPTIDNPDGVGDATPPSDDSSK